MRYLVSHIIYLVLSVPRFDMMMSYAYDIFD